MDTAQALAMSQYYSNMAGFVAMGFFVLVAGIYGGKYFCKFLRWLEYRKARREIQTEMWRNQYYQNVYESVITEDADKEALRAAKRMDRAYNKHQR